MSHAETVLPAPPALLDRGTGRRMKPGMVEDLLVAGPVRVMLLSGRKSLVLGNDLLLMDGVPLLQALSDAGDIPEQMIYLGSALDNSELTGGTDLVLIVLARPVAPGTVGIPEGALWASFRDIASRLGPTATALFVEASSIANWHATHTHCPRCGTPTFVEAGGWVRRCPVDRTEHYPRTDPAIIVTVIGPDGRLLLGGGGPLDAKHYSTLAGFVESGESLEQAVVREIQEEMGVRITACQYLGSQSWPFPASLMLGFTATTNDAEAKPDGVEVTRARWFSREELQSAVLSGEIAIPGRLSIARSLIEHWYGGPLLDHPAVE